MDKLPATIVQHIYIYIYIYTYMNMIIRIQSSLNIVKCTLFHV